MRLPLGESDFKKVIESKFDYVDKSLLIKELIDDNQVVLITRPRRFGKTLNLSMLRYFFGFEMDENTPLSQWQRFVKLSRCVLRGKENSSKRMFKNLAISREHSRYLQHQGQYPVISISFKQVKKNTYFSTCEAIAKLMSRVYTQHLYLLEGNCLAEEEKEVFRSIVAKKASEIDLLDSLFDLTLYLHKFHKKNIVVLIDEYDTPIQQGYLHGYYDDVINFFRGFLGAGLKDNSYVFKAVLTGILRVAQENLFSGLNNLVVYSLLNPNYGAYFGFTEEEVENLLKAANLYDQLDEVKRWYNGYRAGGNVTLYNPWSIASYLKNRELKPYWVNTSDNALIRNLLADSNDRFKQEFEGLISGNPIRHVINEHFVFADLTLNSASSIWNLMYLSGYLKVDSCKNTNFGLECSLSIPNYEIYQLYARIVKTWLCGNKDSSWYKDFITHLLEGDVSSFTQDLQSVMDQIVSFHDTSRDPEAFYHGLVIGLTASLHRDEAYELRSNRESGKGRYDYFILSRDPNKLSILMEFKRVDDADNLEKAAKTALQQIDLKNYFVEAEQRNIKKLLKMGIAFSGKAFSLQWQ